MKSTTTSYLRVWGGAGLITLAGLLLCACAERLPSLPEVPNPTVAIEQVP